MLDTIHDIIARYPVLQLIGKTPLVRIDLFRSDCPDVEVYAKAEMFNPGGSIKDRPVLRMLTEAIFSGDLRHGKTILDSTSGNAGIAYALIGGVLGYPVELVIPGNASEERKRRIRAHGAQIVFTDPSEGYDEALREVHRRAAAGPDRYFFCDQYSNENNWKAHYDTTAAEIIEQTNGRITHFVAGVGTGGTITGTGRRLKAYNPNIEVHCIVPERFPGVEGLKPLGRPEDIVPQILDETIIDARWPVGIEESYQMCIRLARSGLFAGQSSGAYMRGVYDVARSIKQGVIVTILNDIGERYFSTQLWD